MNRRVNPFVFSVLPAAGAAAGLVFTLQGLTGLITRTAGSGLAVKVWIEMGIWGVWAVLAGWLLIRSAKRIAAVSKPAVALSWFHLRMVAAVGFLPFCITTCLVVWELFPEWSPQLMWHFGAAVSVPAGWMIDCWLVHPHPEKKWLSRKVFRLADTGLSGLIWTACGLEILLGIYIASHPSPLFFDSAVTTARIRAHRSPPGYPYFDFRCNSGGYYDTEFFISGPNDLVIAVLSDSFGFGRVPYRKNFVTVAEERVREGIGGGYRRVALHNFGIPCMEMPEYAHLLETEVLQTRPARVVLNLFAGNDIEGLHPAKTRRLHLGNWWIFRVPQRLFRLSREPGFLEDSGRFGTAVDGEIDPPGPEQPTFSDEAFMEIEMQRLPVCNPSDPGTAARYEAFFRALDYFHRRLGDRLAVTIIPDEFQVNDTLYAGLLSRTGPTFDCVRDLPQRRIGDFCANRGIPVLDFLPVLREAERGGRTYLPQDTHWNERGNRIAGERLGAFLIGLIESSRAGESATGDPEQGGSAVYEPGKGRP